LLKNAGIFEPNYTRLRPVPKSRTVELCLHFPIFLHGIVANYIIKYRDEDMCDSSGIAPRILNLCT
jgi:hypothetical protein